MRRRFKNVLKLLAAAVCFILTFEPYRRLYAPFSMYTDDLLLFINQLIILCIVHLIYCFFLQFLCSDKDTSLIYFGIASLLSINTSLWAVRWPIFFSIGRNQPYLTLYHWIYIVPILLSCIIIVVQFRRNYLKNRKIMICITPIILILIGYTLIGSIWMRTMDRSIGWIFPKIYYIGRAAYLLILICFTLVRKIKNRNEKLLKLGFIEIKIHKPS